MVLSWTVEWALNKNGSSKRRRERVCVCMFDELTLIWGCDIVEQHIKHFIYHIPQWTCFEYTPKHFQVRCTTRCMILIFVLIESKWYFFCYGTARICPCHRLNLCQNRWTYVLNMNQFEWKEKNGRTRCDWRQIHRCISILIATLYSLRILCWLAWNQMRHDWISFYFSRFVRRYFDKCAQIKKLTTVHNANTFCFDYFTILIFFAPLHLLCVIFRIESLLSDLLLARYGTALENCSSQYFENAANSKF